MKELLTLVYIDWLLTVSSVLLTAAVFLSDQAKAICSEQEKRLNNVR